MVVGEVYHSSVTQLSWCNSNSAIPSDMIDLMDKIASFEPGCAQQILVVNSCLAKKLAYRLAQNVLHYPPDPKLTILYGFACE